MSSSTALLYGCIVGKLGEPGNDNTLTIWADNRSGVWVSFSRAWYSLDLISLKLAQSSLHECSVPTSLVGIDPQPCERERNYHQFACPWSNKRRSEKFGKPADVVTACVYGGAPQQPQLQALRHELSTARSRQSVLQKACGRCLWTNQGYKPQCVAATPGRLNDFLKRGGENR